MTARIEPRTCSRAEAVRVLSRQLFEDAISASWLRPRSIKPGKTDRKAAKVIFAVEDIRRVEERILAGEYPGKPN